MQTIRTSIRCAAFLFLCADIWLASAQLLWGQVQIFYFTFDVPKKISCIKRNLESWTLRSAWVWPTTGCHQKFTFMKVHGSSHKYCQNRLISIESQHKKVVVHCGCGCCRSCCWPCFGSCCCYCSLFLVRPYQYVQKISIVPGTILGGTTVIPFLSSYLLSPYLGLLVLVPLLLLSYLGAVYINDIST